ncbi:MAG: hypothetical protein CMP28_13965 [Roseibacillus sp.]|nr:hypothetical protein [Roseibacillus sp.]
MGYGIGVVEYHFPVAMRLRPNSPDLLFCLMSSLLLICASGRGWALPVRGETVLTLSDAPGVNVLTVTLAAGAISNEQTTRLAGTVDSSLTIDPATDEVSDLTFNSADITADDMRFLLGFGLIADVTISEVEADLATSLSGFVDAVSGQFDATQHQVTLNRGAITGTSLVGQVDENFTQNPVSGTGNGTGTVTLTRTGVAGNLVDYDILVVLPIQFSNPLQEGVDVLLEGTIQLEGSIAVPLDPYLAWAEANGIPEASFAGDHDGDGIPNGLLWALGYEADERPVLFTPDLFFPGQVDFFIEPGAGGTLAPIVVEESFDLENWFEMDPFLVQGFENPVPAGTVWPFMITLSGGSTGYARLRAQKP